MDLKKLDLSRALCDNLISKEHKETHRMGVGVIVVVVGVSISKISTSYTILHIVLDGFGYFVHAVGCIPFIDHLINRINSK